MSVKTVLGALAVTVAGLAGAAQASNDQWFYGEDRQVAFGCVNSIGFPAIVMPINDNVEYENDERRVVVIPSSLIGRGGFIDKREYDILTQGMAYGRVNAAVFNEAARQGRVVFETVMTGTSVAMYNNYKQPLRDVPVSFVSQSLRQNYIISSRRFTSQYGSISPLTACLGFQPRFGSGDPVPQQPRDGFYRPTPKDVPNL